MVFAYSPHVCLGPVQRPAVQVNCWLQSVLGVDFIGLQSTVPRQGQTLPCTVLAPPPCLFASCPLQMTVIMMPHFTHCATWYTMLSLSSLLDLRGHCKPLHRHGTWIVFRPPNSISAQISRPSGGVKFRHTAKGANATDWPEGRMPTENDPHVEEKSLVDSKDGLTHTRCHKIRITHIAVRILRLCRDT